MILPARPAIPSVLEGTKPRTPPTPSQSLTTPSHVLMHYSATVGSGWLVCPTAGGERQCTRLSSSGGLKILGPSVETQLCWHHICSSPDPACHTSSMPVATPVSSQTYAVIFGYTKHLAPMMNESCKLSSLFYTHSQSTSHVKVSSCKAPSQE